MTTSPATFTLDDALLASLSEVAASQAGYRLEALQPEAIRASVLKLLETGLDPGTLVERARANDPLVLPALMTALSVGETYFFRQPAHFEWIAHRLVPEWIDQGRSQVRAWSAGCATGEEAWSLAASLLAAVPLGGPLKIEVLGTDLLERNVSVACDSRGEGYYTRWSVREAGPLLYPVLRAGREGCWYVLAALAAATRFEQHNLLAPPPGQHFDLVLCRNVLIYFSAEAQRRACARIVESLRPGGTAIFGPMDLLSLPAGLEQFGPSELNLFRKLPPSAPRQATQPAREAEKRGVDPVAMHLRALVFLERGQEDSAARLLAELATLAPGYVPALLERALLHARNGQPERAAELMRQILELTRTLAPAQLVPGPMELQVSFYRASAEAFLSGARI